MVRQATGARTGFTPRGSESAATRNAVGAVAAATDAPLRNVGCRGGSTVRQSRNQKHHHRVHRDHRGRARVPVFSVYSVSSVANVFERNTRRSFT
jgi:hypothetical protein